MVMLERVFDWMREYVANGAVMLLLVAVGVLFTVRSGVFQLRGLPFILKNAVGTLLRRERGTHGVSPFQAMTTALAGTMGVGNIAGVSTALVAGGPGAVFWMWVGAFFGMMTKYAEIFLAVTYRKKNTSSRWYGGPMYYMEACFGNRRMASMFAGLCSVCSLGVGNMTQSNSAAGAMQSAFGVPAPVSGALAAIAVALVIFGGMKRIGSVTEAVIPFLSIVYLSVAAGFLFLHREGIGYAFSIIFREAFTLRSAVSGAAGYGISRAIRIGLARGVFTNEAGLGSAPTAHAAADCESPVHQGAWGIFEVFLDTIVVCTVTALVVLVAEDGALWRRSGLDGAPLTAAAFATTYGNLGSGFLAIAIAFFAVSAMLGWCFYGESALRYLVPGNAPVIACYRLLFVLCVALGSMADMGAVWETSDWMNAGMAGVNLVALWMLRKKVTTSPPKQHKTRKKSRKTPALFTIQGFLK
jgi:AGCS family alanine or glycine:cation symporter